MFRPWPTRPSSPRPDRFFGLSSFERLPALKDLQDIFSGPRYAKWQSFRESEDSRYVGLTVPRFLLRQPYDPENNPVRAFVYKERVDDNHANFLWGNAAFAFASRITDSFAKYRWAANIIGPRSGGAVENLPVHLYESLGDIEMKIPTEILISDRREYELAEQGFIALTMRKGSDNAAFFSANSCQKPKFFGVSAEGKAAELNYRLGAQLPYLFIVSRLAHYIKVLQREHIGSWKERTDLERELNTWIRQYVADQENPSSDTRSRRPLRDARVVVEDVEGDPGWYRVSLSVRPHFKYMGRISPCPWSENWTRSRVMAGSLFDRLTRGEAGLRMDEDESIRRHLMRMLTTRQGAVQALPDYGLPDLNDLSLSRAEVIRRCCSAIEECIAGYEPRLHGAKVGYMHLEEDQFTMAFRIEAMRVDCEGRQIPWRWSVVMDGDQVKETA